MESFCPQCGTHGFAWDGGQLSCEACGYSRRLPVHARAIEPSPLVTPPVSPPLSGLGIEEGLELWTCEHCEGHLLSNKTPSDQCPFCGKKPDPEAEKDDEEDIEVPEIQYPALILPFTLPEQVARQKLKSWVDPNILRPPGLMEGFKPSGFMRYIFPTGCTMYM
jgi:uncharacterized Zn finger protein (UPF0148 family)